MTEDPKDKVARLVREHGIKKQPAEPSYFKSQGDLNIQNSTVIIGGSNHQLRAQSIANAPKPKKVSEMDADEKQAYDSGKWDGLDRRTRGEDDKEYTRALRRRAKRRRDREIVTFHYALTGLLFLALFGSFIFAMLNELGGN